MKIPNTEYIRPDYQNSQKIVKIILPSTATQLNFSFVEDRCGVPGQMDVHCHWTDRQTYIWTPRAAKSSGKEIQNYTRKIGIFTNEQYIKLKLKCFRISKMNNKQSTIQARNDNCQLFTIRSISFFIGWKSFHHQAGFGSQIPRVQKPPKCVSCENYCCGFSQNNLCTSF